ncbi:Potassium voltage-gated channel sub H member 7, partial [Quaeritorhiza haematococci]
FAPVIASFEKIESQEIATATILTSIFAADILVLLHTLHYQNGFLLNIRKSRLLYLNSGDLLLDIIATIPFDIIFTHWEFSETLILIRLLRFPHLTRILSKNPIYASMSKKIQSTLKITHFSSPSWEGLEYVLEKSTGGQYTWAIFAAIGNTFPVTGFRPTEAFEQWATIAAVMIGAILYASLVGTISSFSFGLDSSGRLYKQKMDEVNEYMAYKNLDDGLKAKVR